jgi:hypothetical protein
MKTVSMLVYCVTIACKSSDRLRLEEQTISFGLKSRARSYSIPRIKLSGVPS